MVEIVDVDKFIYANSVSNTHFSPLSQMCTSFSAAYVITHNPWTLFTPIKVLRGRVEYLSEKRFTRESIGVILLAAPLWLNFTVVDIDTRLGYLQREFELTGNELRYVAETDAQIVLAGTGTIQVCCRFFAVYFLSVLFKNLVYCSECV
jgi:hypothetical protein